MQVRLTAAWTTAPLNLSRPLKRQLLVSSSADQTLIDIEKEILKVEQESLAVEKERLATEKDRLIIDG